MLGAFGLYQLLGVPLLERAAPEVLDDIAHLEPYQPPVQRFQPLLAALFPEGSWERGDVVVLKNREMLLVVGRHKALPGGRLSVSPVSIVLCEAGLDPLLSTQAEYPTDTRVWTIRAPGGATLQFDSEVEFEKGSIGKLVSGTVEGQVAIRGCQPRLPNEPPIELLAESLEFDGKRLFSNAEINLQWGSSEIIGRDLTILFEDGDEGQVSRLPGTRKSSLESLTIGQLKRLHLLLPPAWTQRLKGIHPDPTQPIRFDAGSEGPFHIDFTRGFADLRDSVWLTRVRTDGGQDELRCERVVATFTRHSPTKPNTQSQSENMMEIDVPSFQLGQLSLSGQPVQLTIGPGPNGTAAQNGIRTLRLQGTEVHHEPGGTQGIRIVGPGELQAELDSPRAETFSARWQNGLIWHRLDSEEVVVLEKDAHLALAALGSLAAQTIRVSIAKSAVMSITPEAPANTAAVDQKIPLRSISAKGVVRAKASQFDVSTEQLEIELRPADRELPNADTSDHEQGPRMGYARPEQDPRRPKPRKSAQPSFQVQAAKIRATVLQGEDALQVDSVSLQGQLRGTSLASGTATTAPVELRADSLDARDLSTGRGVLVLRGAPAQLRSKQVDLVGGVIHLDQMSNRCWMEGPGSASLPLPAGLAQKMPAYPPVATMTWRNGIDFDGQTLTCHEEVTVRGPMQLMRCPRFAITLDRKIPFTQAPVGLGECNLATTMASGGVFVENRNIDARGTRSIDQAQLQSIAISHADGMVQGTGPGWMQSVSLGTSTTPGLPGLASNPGERSLTFVQVQFQGNLRGNLRRRHVQIANQVRAIYSPVNDWNERVDPNQPGGLPAEAIVLHCDEMDAIQSPLAQPGMGAYELIALGNTTIEGRSFKALGHRVSYDKGKDLMVLEGTDRAYARLWYQDPNGDRTLENSARKIEYWPKRNIVKGEVNFLEFTTKSGLK